MEAAIAPIHSMSDVGYAWQIQDCSVAIWWFRTNQIGGKDTRPIPPAILHRYSNKIKIVHLHYMYRVIIYDNLITQKPQKSMHAINKCAGILLSTSNSYYSTAQSELATSWPPPHEPVWPYIEEMNTGTTFQVPVFLIIHSSVSCLTFI